MNNSLIVPQEINSIVGGEQKEFVVKAERMQPIKKSLSNLLFSLFWLGFTSIFFFSFIFPVLIGEEVHFETNGVPTVAGLDNLKPLAGPALIIGIFVLVGIGMFFQAVYLFLAKGGYFIGTSTRLIIFNKGVTRSIDWEQFTGDIEVSGNVQKGNISMILRTGNMQRNGKSGERYIPETIHMAGINNPFEVEKVCRARIKDNDPTPVNQKTY